MPTLKNRVFFTPIISSVRVHPQCFKSRCEIVLILKHWRQNDPFVERLLRYLSCKAESKNVIYLILPLSSFFIRIKKLSLPKIFLGQNQKTHLRIIWSSAVNKFNIFPKLHFNILIIPLILLDFSLGLGKSETEQKNSNSVS